MQVAINQNANNTKVTLDEINKYNRQLVVQEESNASTLCKYLWHERVYQMMKDGIILKFVALPPSFCDRSGAKHPEVDQHCPIRGTIGGATE